LPLFEGRRLFAFTTRDARPYSEIAWQPDDHMEQIGLPICFKTNATSTAVLNNMFKARKGLNFSVPEPGVCLTVLDGVANRVFAF
jgi:hypothetical protein